MNFATFDLNLLRILDAVFREGSTVRAGNMLGLSQSAISAALSRLRHALDDPLFVRQGNKLVATDFAETLRGPIRDELERIETILTPPKRFEPATATGTFRISAADFCAEMLMPQLADFLQRTAPGIRAQLVDLVPDSYADSLQRYNADLAIIPEQPLPNWIDQEPLFQSPFWVIARDGNPGTKGLSQGDVMPLETFCELSHALFSPEGNLSAMGDAALAKVGRKRQVALTLPVFSGVCRVVSESDLIALLPGQLAKKIARSYGLQVFLPPMTIAPAPIIGIWHKRSNSPLSRWMRQQVFRMMKELDNVTI